MEQFLVGVVMGVLFDIVRRRQVDVPVAATMAGVVIVLACIGSVAVTFG